MIVDIDDKNNMKKIFFLLNKIIFLKYLFFNVKIKLTDDLLIINKKYRILKPQSLLPQALEFHGNFLRKPLLTLYWLNANENPIWIMI